MSEKWLSENVKQNHGPLGAWYPQRNISEGDTPAFLNFVDNGLELIKIIQPEDGAVVTKH
jgi:hypothetical protein